MVVITKLGKQFFKDNYNITNEFMSYYYGYKDYNSMFSTNLFVIYVIYVFWLQVTVTYNQIT